MYVFIQLIVFNVCIFAFICTQSIIACGNKYFCKFLHGEFLIKKYNKSRIYQTNYYIDFCIILIKIYTYYSLL